MDNINRIPATEKQISFIYRLADQKGYIVLDTINNIDKRGAGYLIDFLSGKHNNYQGVMYVLRKRGPKIPNLVSQYLYDDGN